MVALSWEHLEDCALRLVDLKGKTRDLVVVVAVGATRARGEGGERWRVACIVIKWMASVRSWFLLRLDDQGSKVVIYDRLFGLANDLWIRWQDILSEDKR